MPIAKNVFEELERKAETSVKVKSLVADISRILISDVIGGKNEIDTSILNHILITCRQKISLNKKKLLT